MKTACSTLLLLFGLTEVVAQVILLDRATDQIKAKDYAKALESLAIAEQNVITMNDARTYYLKAYALKEQYTQSAAEKGLFRMRAVESIAKCRALDKEKKYEQSTSELQEFIASSTFNTALDWFSAGEYRKCIAEFTTFLKIADTNNESSLDASYYIGASFLELKEYDSAISRFESVKMKNYDSPLLYIDLSAIYMSKGDQKNAIANMDQGALRYPDDDSIQRARVNLYSECQRFKEVEPLLEALLKKHPNNVEIMLVAATIYDRNRSEDTREIYKQKSVKIYQTILAADPNHYEANYNLGVLYYNEGVDLINKNDLDTNLEQLGKVLEKSTALFEQSLPYLVSIYNSKKTDLKLLSALQGIYYNLNMKTEFNEITKLINESK